MIFQQVFEPSGWLTIVRDLLSLVFDEGKKYELIIREYKERRSQKANNYSWALTDKLAEKMLVAGVKLSKEQMHAEMIFRYGQPEYVDGETVVFSIRDGVDAAEYYPYAKEIGQGEVNGNLFNHWRIYRGSHTYNRYEMNLFISGIIEECKAFGIETKTPDEISSLISLMKEADNG